MDFLGGNALLTAILFLNMFLLGVAVMAAYTHWHRHLRNDNLASTSNLPDKLQEKILVQAQDNYEKVLRKSAAEFGKDLDVTTQHLSQQLDSLTGDLIQKETERYRETLSHLQESTTKKFGDTGTEIDTHTAELEAKLNERLQTMDEVLATHQEELQKKLSERTSELERSFQQLYSDYKKKQATLESELAEKETSLMSNLKQREALLASHQVELEQQLVGRQQAFAARQTELEQQLDTEMARRRADYQAAIDTKLSDAVISFLSQTLGRQVDLGAQTPYLIQQLEAHKAELKQELET